MAEIHPVETVKKGGRMKLIYKYPVPIIENAKAEMPIGSEILSAEIDNNELYIYALIDVFQTRKKAYHFKIMSTNQQAESMFGFSFLATVAINRGKLHIFKKE